MTEGLDEGAHVTASRAPLPTFSGTPPFPKAARTALADEQLRRNLRHATTTIRTKRERAVAERADWEELRLAGAAIKDDVIAHLPDLLAQLESNVTAAGGVKTDRTMANQRIRIAGGCFLTYINGLSSFTASELHWISSRTGTRVREHS